MKTKGPNIVLLGGGTGSYELLLGLKNITANITAVVNMCDNGGSTGVLRRDYGVLPPGDVRQCLVALSKNETLAQSWNYRFAGGALSGHPLGNIILSGLELKLGSFEKAVTVAGKMLDIHGAVLPVSTTKHQLILHDGSQEVYGQETVRLHKVRYPDEVRLSLAPATQLNPAARAAITEADMVIIAPGGLYWTLVPLCLVEGVADALQQTKAKVVCVANLMNRPEQHLDWHVMEYVRELERYIGDGVINTVIYNTQPIPEHHQSRYALQGEMPVHTDAAGFEGAQADTVGAALVADYIRSQDPTDQAIERSHIRHDGQKVATEIKKLLETW